MVTKYMQSTYNPFNSQAKMVKHIDKLYEYKLGDTTPLMMEINISSKCPLNCRWCISGNTHKDEFIDVRKLLNCLNDYKQMGGKAVTWSGGGEPTQHPQFREIVLGTRSLGLDQGLMTCGVFSKDIDVVNMCNWVRFSIDTVDPVQYKYFKGVDALDIVKRNIDLVTIKKGLNINLLPKGKFGEQVQGVYDLAVDTDCNYVQVRPVLPRNYGTDVITDQHKQMILLQIRYLKTMDGKIKGSTKFTVSWDKYYDLVKLNYGRTYNKCRGHIFEPVIDSNGDVCVCMYFLRNKDFIMGNIYTQNFYDIWVSQQRKKIKEYCDKLDFSKCQVCCKCHEINKLLDFIDNKEIEDVNFI